MHHTASGSSSWAAGSSSAHGSQVARKEVQGQHTHGHLRCTDDTAGHDEKFTTHCTIGCYAAMPPPLLLLPTWSLPALSSILPMWLAPPLRSSAPSSTSAFAPTAAAHNTQQGVD